MVGIVDHLGYNQPAGLSCDYSLPPGGDGLHRPQLGEDNGPAGGIPASTLLMGELREFLSCNLWMQERNLYGQPKG